MNLIDRYISAVAQQLPASRRDDITRELRANILDRLESLAEEQGHATTTADESAVLRELGHPQQIAASFLSPQTLVNAAWFPIFKQCLFYGLFLVFIVQVIAFSITIISSGNARIGEFIGHFIHAALLTFAIVTGVFYVLSNLSATAKISPYCNWKPEQLPPVQHPWQRIKLEDTVNEFASNLFFLLALLYAFYSSTNTLANLPVAMSPALQTWILPLAIWAIFAVGFSLWNLRHNYWTQPKLFVSIIQNLVGCAIAVVLARVDILLINLRLPAPIATHINDILHWVLILSAGMFLYWAARSAYWLNLTRNLKDN
ncbi:MAG: hypothetical protein EOO68_11045 [Moraxellaceae bacterium]|nr:MAG: hypothetical protein EOO68_11045 [Moraxellaceae bacterium]